MSQVESRSWNWEVVKRGGLWEQPAEEIHYLAHRWSQRDKGRVLDLGCGLGRHALYFAEKGFSVDALDLSAQGLEVLRTEASSRDLDVTIAHGDMLSLPYGDAIFDYLIAYHVIYHSDVNGVESVIRDIDRVLKPGAELFLTFNSVCSPQLTDSRYRKIGPNTIVKTDGPEVGIPHYYVDEAEVRRLVDPFDIHRLTHIEEIDPQSRWRGWHYFVLAEKPRRASRSG